MQNKQRDGNLIYLIIGILGSVIFIFVGYLVSGILGYILEKNYDFLTAFCMIAEQPFANYFNNITPVTMILGFILFEGIYFGIFLRKKKQPEAAEDLFVPDIVDVADRAGLDNIDEEELFKNIVKVATESIDEQLDESGYVSPNESDEAEGASNSESVVEEKEKELSFSDEIVTELLEDYNLAQIKSMLALKAYIEIEDAGLLKRMFKPSMSAEDILSYISLFYD